MDEQVSIFAPTQNDTAEAVAKSIYQNLQPTLKKNHLDEAFLYLNKAAGYWSILFEGVVVARVHLKPLAISFKKTVLRKYEKYEADAKKGKDPFLKIRIANHLEVSEYAWIAADALQMAIDSYPKEWDCCSRFEQCSDALKCVHPDKYEGIKCGYRKALASGRVFYGKNRNVGI